MHVGGFSRVRDFVLNHSAIIVQDDSGIPLKYLSDGSWNLYPFGQYIPPIDVFKHHVQPDMAQLFTRAQRVNFGIGYRSHPTRTTILVATRASRPARTASVTAFQVDHVLKRLAGLVEGDLIDHVAADGAVVGDRGVVRRDDHAGVDPQRT